MHKGVLTYNEIILSLSLHLNRSYTSYKLINYVVVLQFDEMMNYVRFKWTIQLIVVLFLYLQPSFGWLLYCLLAEMLSHFTKKSINISFPCQNLALQKLRRCNCCCLLRQFTIFVTCVRSWWLQKWRKIASSQSLHPWHRLHLQASKVS